MKPLIIIPAAGFGRRVGSPESKEMGFRPDGSRLIDWPLQLAKERDWPVHVICRKEKKSLIEYLNSRVQAPTIQLVQATYDWPETILHSQPYWLEWNLIFLPDMEFSPVEAIDKMAKSMALHDVDLVAAQHEVKDLSEWGVLRAQSDGDTEIIEKPDTHNPGKAWGLYAFRARIGERLLKAQLESTKDHLPRRLPFVMKNIELQRFVDLTR